MLSFNKHEDSRVKRVIIAVYVRAQLIIRVKMHFLDTNMVRKYERECGVDGRTTFLAG